MSQIDEGAQRAEVADLRAGCQPGRDGVHGFVVTIRTPAGHEHQFLVDGTERVATVTDETVGYFVAHHELAEGKCWLCFGIGSQRI